MKVVKSIAKNTSALTVARILRKVFSAFVSILLIRYLGSQKYGEFSFIYAYLSFFHIFSSFGIDNIVIREASRFKEKAPFYLGNALILRFTFSIFSLLLSWFILLFLRCPFNLQVLVYLASIELLLSFKSIYSLVFNIELKLYYQAFIHIFSGFLDAGLTLFFIYLKAGLTQFILIGIFVALIEFVCNRYFAQKLIIPVFKINFQLWKYILKESWPLALTSVFVIIYFRIDQVMIYKMIGPFQLGLYSLAVKITEYINIIPESFMTSVFPVMAYQFLNCKDSFRRVYFLSSKYLMMVAWPVAAFLSFYSRNLISLIFGKEYILASPIFSLLVWSSLFIFTGALGNKAIISIGRQKIDVLITALSSSLNIILNLLFIPRLGIKGAALATLISYSSTSIIAYSIPYLRYFVKVQIETSIKPLFSSFVFVSFCYIFARKNIFLGLIIAGVVYLVSMWYVKGLDREDLVQFKKVFRKR